MKIRSEDLIHFVGRWTEAERRRLRRAVGTFERSRIRVRPSAADEQEWIAVQETPVWGRYYFAHRLGTHDSLTAQSAAELADVIEESARELQLTTPHVENGAGGRG